MDLFRRLWPGQGLRAKLKQSRDRLYRVAYSWCHEQQLADDLVQQTLVKALQSGSLLRDVEAIDAWLFRIMSNCWRDHFRRQRETVDIEDAGLWHEETPEKARSRDEIVVRVRKAIAALPMPQREVVTLVDLGGLSYTEVAVVLDIPIGTVMSRLCRARRVLKELLLELNPVNETQPRIRRVK